MEIVCRSLHQVYKSKCLSELGVPSSIMIQFWGVSPEKVENHRDSTQTLAFTYALGVNMKQINLTQCVYFSLSQEKTAAKGD